MTTLARRLTTWRYVMNHANMPEGVKMDWLSKWLIVTRATVFSMTATSGLIGGLLAIGTVGVSVNYWYLALSIIGLVIAHAANNMINDYFDLQVGIDTGIFAKHGLTIAAQRLRNEHASLDRIASDPAIVITRST